MKRFRNLRQFALIVAQILLLDSKLHAAELDLLPSIIVSPSNSTVRLQQLASLSLPSDMAPVPDQSGKLFVTELSGAIHVIDGSTIQTYHTMTGANTISPVPNGDTAFTSIAFHPGFADASSPGYRKFYTLEPEKPATATATFTPQFSSISVANTHHQDVLYEYTVADPAANSIGSFAKREIMRANQPRHNHNFNDLEFDENELLYIGVGDGGNNATERQNSPSLSTVYGKILRIDPLGIQGTLASNGQYSTPNNNPFAAQLGTRKEIFAYGLRNPYRISIDPITNHLYIADVGQDNVEEVNVIPNVLSASAGGQHFGWPGKEGSILFPSFNPDPDHNNNGNGDIADANGWTDPIFDYDHQDGADIIGGFVYRGSLLPELYGKYVFADHQGSRDPQEPIPNIARLFYGDLSTGNIFQFNTSGLGNTLPTRILSIGQDSYGELYVLGVGGVYSIGPKLPGDYNHDGEVNAADYVIWRDSATSPSSYGHWKSNFGATSGAGTTAAVPEPSGLDLCVVVGGLLVATRFRR